MSFSLHNLLMEVFNEAFSHSESVKVAKKLVQASGGDLEYQKANRVRGTIDSKQFIDLIANTFNIPSTKIKHIPPVKNRSASDYESSLYYSYEFDYNGTTISLILTDPKYKQSSKEKQEHSLIETINSISGEKTIISSNKVIIKKVVKAAKSIAKGSEYRSQPYADVDLYINGEPNLIKISAKGPTTPSVGGGGLIGVLELKIPELTAFIKTFYEKALALAKSGDMSDKYVEVPKKFLVALFTGNANMGGPINYYYKGSLIVNSTIVNNVIKLDGDLYTPEEYATQHTYYFRIGKRRVGGKVTDAVRNYGDIPYLYVDDNGKPNSRLFVTDTLPPKVTVIQI